MTTVSSPAAPIADGVALDPPLADTRRPRLAWRAVGVVVAVKVVVNAVFSARYGWHRDELYYADTGRHLALGYVDFPPATPWLAAVGRVLFADSLVGLRLIASLAGAGVIVVTAAITRDLGGGRRAQLIAAIAVTPLVVGSNAMFQTVSFDQLAWAFTIWAAVTVLRRGTLRSWLLLGMAAGVAWNTKYTVGVLLAGLAMGFVVTRSGRTRLHGPGPWLAVAVALVLAAPNLWWQVHHGWVSVDFLRGRDGVRDDNPPLRFVLELLVVAGPAALVLWLSGLRTLLRDRFLRPLGIALAFVAPAWLLLGGKSYYAAPLVIGAFAAGGVAWERGLAATAAGSSSSRWWIWPAVIAGTAAAASPMILPVLPTTTMVDAGMVDVRDDYGAELGWPELAATVGQAWRTLTPAERERTAVVAADYVSAGAVDRFGGRWDLPPAVSGHLTWQYWTPDPMALAATNAIVVGYGSPFVARHCTSHRRLGTVDNRWHVDNGERGAPVWSCELPGTVADLRPALAHLG